MACFLVPATEAIVTTVISKAVKYHESKRGLHHKTTTCESEISLSKKISRLSGFLYGGSALLAFEHLWNGEITPVFPFLTAAGDPQQMSEVFHEMATIGTSMAVLVTAFWGVLTIASDTILKRNRFKKAEGKAL